MVFYSCQISCRQKSLSDQKHYSHVFCGIVMGNGRKVAPTHLNTLAGGREGAVFDVAGQLQQLYRQGQDGRALQWQEGHAILS